MKAKIKIKLDKGAAMPTRAHESDVGYDIKALHTYFVTPDGFEIEIVTREDCELLSHEESRIYKIKIDTGVHVKPEAGYYVEVVPNSRLSKTPFVYGNSIGIIDPEYTGSIKVVLSPCEEVVVPDLFKFLPGNVVGQLIIRHKHDADFEQVDQLEETERGEGGFGSTEKK